tara:strand:- start:34712 stop:35737 length:1026 start_codon:yes stop_codon:yes gene_type:complete
MILFVRGESGCGKSTLANILEKRLNNAIVIEADNYWYDKSGNYNFDIKLIKDAHQWAMNEAQEAYRKGMLPIISNTSTRTWEMEQYITAIDSGLTLSDAIFVRAEGGTGNTHGVPDDIVAKQIERYEDVQHESIVNAYDEEAVTKFIRRIPYEFWGPRITNSVLGYKYDEYMKDRTGADAVAYSEIAETFGDLLTSAPNAPIDNLNFYAGMLDGTIYLGSKIRVGYDIGTKPLDAEIQGLKIFNGLKIERAFNYSGALNSNVVDVHRTLVRKLESVSDVLYIGVDGTFYTVIAMYENPNCTHRYQLLYVSMSLDVVRFEGKTRELGTKEPKLLKFKKWLAK